MACRYRPGLAVPAHAGVQRLEPTHPSTCRSRPLRPRTQDEAHLPSLQSSPRAYAWFSRPHEDPRRQGRDQCTPRQGAQAPGRLSRGGRFTVKPVLGRILRSADFERVLGRPACVRSPHFAIHYADARPTPTSSPPGRAQRVEVVVSEELSTGHELACTQLVDDLPWSASSRDAKRTPQLWFGAIVPKRHARRAVTRTLIKRQIRAAMMRRAEPGEPSLRAGLWVVRLRAPFDRAAYPSAASRALCRDTGGELDALLGEAQRKLASSHPAPDGAR